MQFTKAIHVFDAENRLITFGRDRGGQIWLVIDSATPNPIYRGPFPNLGGFAIGLANLSREGDE